MGDVRETRFDWISLWSVFSIPHAFCSWLYWTLWETWPSPDVTPIAFLKPLSQIHQHRCKLIHLSCGPLAACPLGRAFTFQLDEFTGQPNSRMELPTPHWLKKVPHRLVSCSLVAQWALCSIPLATLPGVMVINACKYFYNTNPQ